MISDYYTIGLGRYHETKSKNGVFGNKPQDIEGYQEAISSDELYIPHHKMEIFFTHKELEEMGRYDPCPANELIWLPISEHHGSRKLHVGLRVCNIGRRKGQKYTWTPETKERHFYKRYETLVEKISKLREIQINRVRFELTLTRTDISKQRKYQIMQRLLTKPLQKEIEYQKKLARFLKLLEHQKKMNPKFKCYRKVEQKLMEMIDDGL